MTTSPKVALITGITGQDGSYLAELLLEKGYEVHGIKRRASSFNTQRVDHIYQEPHVGKRNFVLHYGDLADSSNLTRIVHKVQPDEVYNLGAQSHVAVSFEAPEYTADVDAIGTLRLLEAIRILGLERKSRFYQASTSELYGLVQEIPQKETTPFHPRSPYAVAKLYAYWITVNYREAYGLHASNGILFNHESPRRGETFVTRKITRGLANIAQGLETCLYMGNIECTARLGPCEGLCAHAVDDAAAGQTGGLCDCHRRAVLRAPVHRVVRRRTGHHPGLRRRRRGRVRHGRAIRGRGRPCPEGEGRRPSSRSIPRYFRPAEVETLLGDPTKARTRLGWTPQITVQEMCAEMVAHDLKEARQHALLKQHGHNVSMSVEE